MLDAIARALRLDGSERLHLHNLARSAKGPARGRRPAAEQVTEAAGQLLEALADVPAIVTGTLLRVPVLRDGRAGAVRTEATGLSGIDDFAFTGHGDQILAALNGPGEVALVQPDGTHSIVLTPADGLQNPTSVALRGHTVYVMSAAYVTATDPNLVLAHLDE